jgi:hypothetical protein
MPIPSDEGIPNLWGLLADPGGGIIAVVIRRHTLWRVKRETCEKGEIQEDETSDSSRFSRTSRQSRLIHAAMEAMR